MDVLPIELIDAILELVYYNKGVKDHDTLLACALVSRSLREPAQRFIFRHVTMHSRRQHGLFLEATDLATSYGHTLAEHVRIIEVSIGAQTHLGEDEDENKTRLSLDDQDLADLLNHTPRLYELILRVSGIHQLGIKTMTRLHALSNPQMTSMNAPPRMPLRVRALSLLSCGIQSPIAYQLLSVWPSIEFLVIGVEIAAPPPQWLPAFKLYQLTLMRTPRLPIISWLLSTSKHSLQIVSFRDAPGRELDPLLDEIGPQLRSLRLMNYSLRTTEILKRCPSLEEFVIVQLSTLFDLEALPKQIEHLSCRNLPMEPQRLDLVIRAVKSLPRLRVVTCDPRARLEEQFVMLERLCGEKGIELFVDEVPFWVREDSVRVDRFPKRKSAANFLQMN